MTVQYLIDSENVGDFWISLLELPADQTELIVFYTRNSPHMSYESLIKLKESDRTVTFIKCYEGTNALDFQLVTELGYRISKNESDRFVIVTNDTGFDAAVKYWRRSKKSVKRITGKECKNLERRRREDLEWRNASDRTRDHVNRAVTGEEAETAAASSAVSSADPAEMQDVRPSRPVLRDAETAAEPEAEEADFVEEDFDSIPENEDEDYDPDFEEEEDDTDETASDEVSSDEMSADNESIYDDSDEETGSEDEYDTHDYSDAEYSDQEPLSQDESDPEQVPEYDDADKGSQDPESSLIGSAQDIQKPDTSYAGAGMDSAFASSVSETEDGEESPGLRNDLNEDLRERFGEEFREEFKDGLTEEISAPTPSGSHEKGKTRLKGYNSDVIGFTKSIEPMLDKKWHKRALILGTGGASKAINFGLKSLGIEPVFVSRYERPDTIQYNKITPEVVKEYNVIVNCTPVGMYPHTEECPPLPYEAMDNHTILYDLIYNPDQTLFMRKGAQYGADVKNGLEMLLLQAFASWEFWNDNK